MWGLTTLYLTARRTGGERSRPRVGRSSNAATLRARPSPFWTDAWRRRNGRAGTRHKALCPDSEAMDGFLPPMETASARAGEVGTHGGGIGPQGAKVKNGGPYRKSRRKKAE